MAEWASPERIAGEFGVSVDQVRAALSFQRQFAASLN
jgi:hypothetical protein